MTSKRLSLLIIYICTFASFASNATDNTEAKAKNYKNPRAKEMLKVARDFAETAPLPRELQQFRIATSGGMFSRAFHLSFKASKADIEIFLKNSPSLKNLTVTKFTKEKQYLPGQPDLDFKELLNRDREKHKHFTPRKSTPSWYIETIKISGRRYQLEPSEGHRSFGEVIINDSTNTVYIYVCWS